MVKAFLGPSISPVSYFCMGRKGGKDGPLRQAGQVGWWWGELSVCRYSLGDDCEEVISCRDSQISVMKDRRGQQANKAISQ